MARYYVERSAIFMGSRKSLKNLREQQVNKA